MAVVLFPLNDVEFVGIELDEVELMEVFTDSSRFSGSLSTAPDALSTIVVFLPPNFQSSSGTL